MITSCFSAVDLDLVDLPVRGGCGLFLFYYKRLRIYSNHFLYLGKSHRKPFQFIFRWQSGFSGIKGCFFILMLLALCRPNWSPAFSRKKPRRKKSDAV
jgi:hypothetical protein